MPGSIGKAMPATEVRFLEDGEMLIKSPCLFSGYLNDPDHRRSAARRLAAHRRSGHADSEGYIFITGARRS